MVVLATACGGAAPVRRPQRLPHVEDLRALVPEGADTIVVARPAALYAAAATRTIVDVLAPPRVLDAYAQRTGVDPRRAEEAIVAEYPDGALLIVRGPFHAPTVVREAGARMATLEASTDRPFVRRAGFFSDTRWDVMAVDDNVVVAVSKMPSVAREIARARRAGRVAVARPALAAQDVAHLVGEHVRAPVVVFAPRPLELPEGYGTSVLLARERALAAQAVPSGADAIAIQVDLRGEFPPGAEANFRTLVESIAHADMGRALGLEDGLESLRIESSDRSVVLRMRVPVRAVVMGLEVLFVGEIDRLLEVRQTP